MLKVSQLIRSFVILLGMLVINFTSLAQPTDPETNPDVPISGIEILVGLGGLWGARKYAAMRKRKKG